MVHIYAVYIMQYQGPKSAPILLFSNYDLSTFGFFQKRTVKELITFFSREVLQRTKLGERNVIKEGDYICHAYIDSDGFGAAVITDTEYPTRVALSLAGLILKEFYSKRENNVSKYTEDRQLLFPSINELMSKYQNPESADNINKIQNDLNDIEDILHQSLTALLERGEKIETLVDRSNDLSTSSKDFYREARRNNQCCFYM